MTRLLNLIPRKNDFLPAVDLFDRFFDDLNVYDLFGEDTKWVPAFDISETNKEYIVTAEMPGIDVKDVDIALTEGILSVKGEKRNETEDKGEDYHRIERRYGSFHRSFRIPGRVESDKVDATYKDGILKLTLPKVKDSETKKIDVK